MASTSTGRRYARRNATLREMGFETYASYLASPLWGKIKGNVLRRDKGRCQICMKLSAYTAHHISYSKATLRGRDISQLIAVCRGCHRKLEFAKGEKLLTTKQVAKRLKKVSNSSSVKRRFRPRCVVCHEQTNNIGRDDICMPCYRSGKALAWRNTQCRKDAPAAACYDSDGAASVGSAGVTSYAYPDRSKSESAGSREA